jgi:hypothetical protein
VALAASISIAVGGIVFDLSARLLGMIALVPTGAMLVNTVYQPHDRARWHYTKRDRLNALRRRIMYELPEQLSGDDVAAVSHDWSTLNAEMDAQWYKSIRINWKSHLAVIRRHRATVERSA